MTQNWDQEKAGNILVACRGSGEHFIVDGLQRSTALKQRGEELVEALVFISKGQEHEAKLFLAYNKDRTGMNPKYLFQAKLTAGDPVALGSKKVAEECGFTLDGRRKAKILTWPHILCYSVVMNIYEKDGAERLREILELIKKVWNGDSDAIRQYAIAGIGLFLRRYKGHEYFSESRLGTTLKKMSPAQFLHTAHELQKAGVAAGSGMQGAFCEAIRLKYNGKKRSKTLEAK